MHPQSTEQQAGTVRVAFDVMAGVEPLTFPADATNAQITSRLHHKFLLADVIDDGNDFTVAIDREAGTVIVSVDGDVIEHGSVTRVDEQPELTTLGAQIAFQRELRRLADDIVEHNLPVPTFSLRIGGCVESRDDAQAWADFLGVEITWGGTTGNIPVAAKNIEFGDGQYLHLSFQAPSEERPVDPEKAALAARVAELEAKLAEGGAAR